MTENIFNTTEIERRFLISDPPDCGNFSHEQIFQAYIEGQSPVRLRCVNNQKFFLTYKEGHGLQRTEFEIEIPQGLYSTMLPLTSRSLEKIRFCIEDGLTLDIITDSALGTIMIAEKEFKTIEEARRYAFPMWCHTEITEDPKFSSYNLSKPYTKRNRVSR